MRRNKRRKKPVWEKPRLQGPTRKKGAVTLGTFRGPVFHADRAARQGAKSVLKALGLA